MQLDLLGIEAARTAAHIHVAKPVVGCRKGDEELFRRLLARAGGIAIEANSRGDRADHIEVVRSKFHALSNRVLEQK